MRSTRKTRDTSLEVGSPLFITGLFATEDVDLLVDADPDNQARVKKALEVLPQKAILELGADDFRKYTVVRVSDEVLVDLMTAACGIDYKEASRFIEVAHVQGVPIPFATPQLLCA